MTTGTVKTQGTELFFIDHTTTSDTDLVKLACPTGITGLGGPRAQINVTCLSATEDEEFVGGLGVPGTVTVPFNLIPRDHSQQILFDLKKAGTTLKWLACLSEGTSPPTVSDDHVFVPPTGRSSIAFDAYVSDVNINIATNEIVRGTLTLQRSGAVVPHFYTPAA